MASILSTIPLPLSPYPGLSQTSHLGGLVPSVNKGPVFSGRGQLPRYTFCKRSDAQLWVSRHELGKPEESGSMLNQTTIFHLWLTAKSPM